MLSWKNRFLTWLRRDHIHSQVLTMDDLRWCKYSEDLRCLSEEQGFFHYLRSTAINLTKKKLGSVPFVNIYNRCLLYYDFVNFRVVTERTQFDSHGKNTRHVIFVDDKKCWPKDSPLRDATENRENVGICIVNTHIMITIGQEHFYL